MKNKKILIIVIMFLVICLVALLIFKKYNSKNENVVTIWAYDSTAKIAEKAVEIYEKNHPNLAYDFNVVSLGQEDMVEKIKTYLVSGSKDSLPNIFYDEDYNFLEYVSYYEDSFKDLSNYIKSEDFDSFKMINVTYNGKVYAIPYDCGVGTLFYRIDLIEQAGYTEADMQNLTWDKYIEIGKKVKSKTGIDMLPLIPEGDMEGRLMYQSAGTWFFDENGNANIEGNKAFEDSFKNIKKIVDSGIVYPTSSWDSMIASISNKKIASLVGGSWWAPIIESYTDQSGLWRVAIMPRMTAETKYSNSSNLGGGNWFVVNKENSSAAVDFAVEMFGNSQELANYSAEEYYIVPVKKEFIDNLSVSESEFFTGQKVTSLMANWAKDIPAVKYGLHTYEITYTVGEFVADYLSGELTFSKAIEEMQKAAEQVVSE